MVKTVLAVLGLLLIGEVHAQPHQYRFYTYNEEDGLPGASVNTVAEDAFGFIWIGTDDGLSRFDSYSFRNYRQPAHGLRNNYITTIYPLPSGDLWVGTDDGLLFFDAKREQFSDFWKRFNNPPAYISRIVSDRDDGFWIGSSEGLFHLNPRDSSFRHFKPDLLDKTSLPSAKIFDVLLDRSNRLWVSSSRAGLSLYLGEGKGFKNYRKQENGVGISSDVLRTMGELPDGRILIGTANDGLNILDPSTGMFSHYNHDPADVHSLSSTSVFSVLVDRDKHVWLGTWSHGLNRFDPATGKSDRYVHIPGNEEGLPNNSIQCLYQSSSGDIWIGTNEGGLVRMNPREQQLVRYRFQKDTEQSILTNYIKSVYEDESGMLWIGTSQSGLHRYDRNTRTFTYYLRPVTGSRDELSRGTIWAIASGEGQTLWLGTSRGLASFDRQTGKTKFYEPDETKASSISGNNVLTVLDDGTGHVWAGTWYGGVNRLTIATGAFEHFMHDEDDPGSLAANNVNFVFQDSRRRIWVATEKSLSLYNERTNSFSHVNIQVMMMCEGPDGTLWLATGDGALNYDPESGKIVRTLSEQEGLMSNRVSSLIVDAQGMLWVGTNRGVDCVNLQSGTIVHLTKADGLAGNHNESRACFLSRTGTVYLGGTQGLSEIPKNAIRFSARSVPVRLTNLLLFNRAVEVGDTTVLKNALHTLSEITLKPTDNYVAFEFAAMDFDQPQLMEYQFRLEGLDTTWIRANYTDRKAVYTNLPPGHYTFHVKAGNLIGASMQSGEALLSLVVLPPWWKTWWARVLLYCSVLAVVLGFVQVRLSLVRRQKQVLEREVAARTAEVLQQKEELESQAERLQEVNQQKTKLFSIIAHDLRSPLNSLKGLMPLLDPRILTAEDLSTFRDSIQGQLSSVDGVMENLLVWAKGQLEGEVRRPDVFDINRVIKELADVSRPVLSQKNITLQVEQQEPQPVFADINQIRAVFRNLISNAIKFTDPGGAVTVRIASANSMVHVAVQDTGVGMAPEKLAQLFSIQTNVSTVGTQGEKGVGLGLLLVKEFALKNGGDVTVESAPGRGTTFTVTIPHAESRLLARAK